MPAGGKREGSGRKAAAPDIKRVQMVITISPETKIKLNREASRRALTVGRMLDSLFQDYEEE